MNTKKGIYKLMMKNFIWDFDGTLFDTYPSMTGAFRQALKDYGIEEEENDILQFMKISAKTAIDHYENQYNLPEEFEKRYKGYERATEAGRAIPFTYAKEICQEIVNGGGHNFIMTHRGNSTFKYLKHYNMEKLFTEIVTKHNGFKRKPDPEAYLYIVDKYGLNKKETIIIGDRDFEILGGKQAGIKVCLYNTNNISITVKPDYEIKSLKELQKFIE